VPGPSRGHRVGTSGGVCVAEIASCGLYSAAGTSSFDPPRVPLTGPSMRSRSDEGGDRWVAIFGRLFGVGLRTKQADQGRPHLPALPTPSLLFAPPLRHTQNSRCLPIFAREKYDTINVASAISATDVTTTWTLLRFHQPDTPANCDHPNWVSFLSIRRILDS
jgi:hypothetical protein